MNVKLKRTIQEWRNLDPVNIAQRQGRPVAKHALVDAKHDILALAAKVEELEAADVQEELFQVRQDRDAHFGELMRALEQVDAMKAECDVLAEALTELCDEIDNHEIHAAISKTNILWFKRKARAALRKNGGGK